MKIVINALSARLGGGQTYIKNLLNHLPSRDDIQLLVYAQPSLPLPGDSRIRRMETRWPVENPLLRTIWEKLVLPWILRREKADVLFCPGGMLTTRVSRRCRTVTMFRNMLPFDDAALARMPWGLQKLRNFILKRGFVSSIGKADLVIFISEYSREMIESLTRVKKAVTIPHGIGEMFKVADRALPRPLWLPQRDYILYVSRFDVYKHQYEVAQAYADLPAPLRQRYALVLVGEADNPLAEDVKAFASSRNLTGDICIFGAVPYTDLPAVYRHATVNVFASSCETCPNILLEALAAGRPVLSSSVMPMPEFGKDAVAYFAPKEPESLRQALVEVLEDDAYRNRLAQAAAQRSADFDWERSASETWGHIAGLTCPRRIGPKASGIFQL